MDSRWLMFLPSQQRHHSTHPHCPFLDRAVNGGEESAVGGEEKVIAGDLTRAEARSALAWWLQAGVDVAIQEEPRNWLKAEAPRARSSVIEPPVAPDVVQPSRETLAELQQWLASSVELPLAGTTAKRVAPHGPEQAAIMLLSDAPTLEDAAAGQPIG